MKNFFLNHIKSFLLLLALILLSKSISEPFSVLKHAVELNHFKGLLNASVYLGSYILIAFALTLILNIKSSKLFSVFLFLFFIFFSIDFFMQFIGSSYGFSYNDFALAVNEAGNYNNLLAYFNYLIYALLLAFVLSFILYVIRKKLYTTPINSFFIMMYGVAIIGTFLLSRMGHTNEYKMYPSFIKIPLYSLRYFKTPLVIKDRVFAESIATSHDAKYKNIIWIVDESITGSYLSINGYDKETTPYLTSIQNQAYMVNFGSVNSISNCSAESNLFLRIGLNPLTYTTPTKEMFQLPTIYQYAKRAGFTTSLIDVQAHEGSLQDHLTPYDKEDLDFFETLPTDTAPEERDIKAITLITDKLNNHKNNFIVLVKWGAHWPYLLDYTQDDAPFQPELESALGGMSLENKEKITNTYLNAIKYATDTFLKRILKHVDLTDNIIFYTSDHGQNILEKNNKDFRTHCHTLEETVQNEVTVPLFIFQENAKMDFPINRDNQYSQIQMFPTTLLLMGYDSDIVKRYGNPLPQSISQKHRKSIIRLKGDIYDYD